MAEITRINKMKINYTSILCMYARISGSLVFLLFFLSLSQTGIAQIKSIDVGVARMDISPVGPIRLAGFAVRDKKESEGILQPLFAKALAFGNDKQGPSILITVDLIGIPAQITEKVAQNLSKKAGIREANFAISASHTHSGPEMGNLLNILQYRSATTYSDSLLPADQINRIVQYSEQLSLKLEEVALAALKNRKPSLVSWGQGNVAFAENRRMAPERVDRSMPLLKVTDLNGKVKAVLVNYACHAVSIGPFINKIHGDWVGDAQRLIEADHPEAIAMVAVGCGADSNPSLIGLEEVEPLLRSSIYGKMIADETKRLLGTSLRPLNSAPIGRLVKIDLPFNHVPDINELVSQTADNTVKGYYARLALDRIARGGSIPSSISYPVQSWTFGKDLAMVFLAGEVVADYSLRLKKELGSQRLWINAYSNDAPSYISSKRVIREGGYEGALSMYYYDKPAPYDEAIEDKIINTVHQLIPAAFKTEKRKNR